MDGSGHRPVETQFRLADELRRAADLIDSIGDAEFCRPSVRGGSVSAHFRHDLEIANCLLRGIESGKVDYTNRERDLKLESDRSFAVEQNLITARRYELLSPTPQRVMVRSETDPACWHSSSVARELDFVLSHTIHHHALIAERLAYFDIPTDTDFGVAPSTLEFWQTRAA